MSGGDGAAEVSGFLNDDHTLADAVRASVKGVWGCCVVSTAPGGRTWEPHSAQDNDEFEPGMMD